MTTLLRIDSSLRMNDSYSRSMGDYFVQQWKIKHPNGKIIERDVTLEPTPHLTQETINGFFDETLYSEHLKLSDQLIEELYISDEILITCPMYNYGIPSSLKAYFDLVVRTKKTFTYDNNGIKGLLLNKRAFIISTMGILQPIIQKQNPIEIQLTSIFNQLGIMEITYFPMDGMINPDDAGVKIEQQRKQINQHLNY
ncbi:NAD(P)H-dependent oxidoreductase [Chryseobacterium sp. ISL-6]|uniref:FMN-dependent NADH-azoreductase n=1 Tax=Chryseobacterium sp. ISL-6 TaxID=2819143 RepID=UPI001BE6708D|nr:NAD(P)H-dependent oxidoreductase [Chryseobacterium sp. ISL-6]MBT2623577.1 NAD(P)H-dependent oxidoreductase [Chryseobacterium sp. ISL-6]